MVVDSTLTPGAYTLRADRPVAPPLEAKQALVVK
jgi:hypothetical protein